MDPRGCEQAGVTKWKNLENPVSFRSLILDLLVEIFSENDILNHRYNFPHGMARIIITDCI